MNYKIERTLQKNKKTIILAAILWLIITIVLVMPVARAWNSVITEDGKVAFDIFLETAIDNISYPLDNIANLGTYWNSFISVLWKSTLVLLAILIIGLVKTAPKNEYTDIEHGSSDWCERGEQYKVLSRNKGIILGENNYLPVDKRGNVNVLVVGRIRCW